MILKQVLNVLNKEQTKKFYICGFLNFLNAILELIGLVSITVIVLLIVSPDAYLEKLNNFNSIFFKQIIDQMRNMEIALYFSGFVFFITTIIKLLIKQYSIKLSINLSTETSNLLFKNYINKKYIYLFESTSAKLLSLVNHHSPKFSSSIISSLQNLINSFSLIIILLGSLIYVGGVKSLISLLIVTTICGLTYFIIRKKIHLNELAVIQSDVKRQHILNESYNNIKYLKLSKKYIRLTNLFDNVGKIYSKALTKNQQFLHVAKPMLEIAFLIIAIVFINLTLDNNGADIIKHIPVISFILLSFYRMIPSVQIIFQSMVHIKGALETLSIIENEVMQTELQEKPINQKNVSEIIFNEKIEISSINFNYQSGKRLFHDISLKIKKNSCVVFIGKSGQGKTTIVDIICKLLEPINGKLLVDGIEINEKNKYSYQNKIGYLSQSFYIINDSLINNVIFYDEINQENIKKAKFFLSKLFDEIEVKNLIDNQVNVGENGVKLSHGQRQRLLIVRLLYENKSILILDEPTSALDEKNVEKLIEILKNLKKNKTIILTSHHKDVLEVCDQTFLVANGKVEKK